MNQTQVLFRGEESALKKSQVGSIPVAADKKFPRTEIVGDFSLIPATAIQHLELIGSIQLKDRRLPTNTKSTQKGWRLTATW